MQKGPIFSVMVTYDTCDQISDFCHQQFHKNPISRLGGVALTRYMDGRTDRRTDGRTG